MAPPMTAAKLPPARNRSVFVTDPAAFAAFAQRLGAHARIVATDHPSPNVLVPLAGVPMRDWPVLLPQAD